jgi:hypothetical protein
MAKTTMNYNNVIITVGGNNAVVMTEASYKKGQFKQITASSSFVAALKGFDFILDKISDNTTIEKAITRIYLPDLLKGFAMGTFVEYIRTNKTSSGRTFTAEEKELVLSIANKMMNKGFNMVPNESRFFPKELKPMKDMAMSKAKELKENAPATQAQPQAQPQAKSPVLVALEEQMAKAIAEANFELYDKLEERYNKMVGQATTPVAPTAVEEPEEEEVYEENEVELDEELADIDC